MLILAAIGLIPAQNPHLNPLPHWALGGFVRPIGINPIISPDESARFFDPMTKSDIAWESNDTFNPGATVYKGQIVILYRSEDKTGVKIGTRTSRLGYASSRDGVHFERRDKPVFYPDEDGQKANEWPGGCEDPRVCVTDDGTYVMLYTQWNRKNARLAVATSKDLTHWMKHGPIFERNGIDLPFYKSGSIVTHVSHGRQTVAKIGGKYWMYWGESAVFAATSNNLVDWTPLRTADGKLRELIKTRKGFFDSSLTECGPPAVLTKDGIVLLYNGKNDGGDNRDPRFTPNAYCAGQVLFSKDDPTKPLGRLDVPFLRPMEPFEKSGQYVAGTVFVEGLTFFRDKWYLYYGCADSRVGVAVFDPRHPGPGDPLP
ncbi:MAG: hypothetical protein JST51_07655 [Armatimonadetes bacterium]|nr:hypothetical protein [Armatimonadota bacterium]